MRKADAYRRVRKISAFAPRCGGYRLIAPKRLVELLDEGRAEGAT